MDHGESIDLSWLGNAECRNGNLRRATALAGEALTLVRALGDPRRLTECLEDHAVLAAVKGQGARAGRLEGAAKALRADIGVPQPPWFHAETQAMMAPVRAAMGEEAWRAAVAAGRALSLEEAIAEALGESLGEQQAAGGT